jgi:hypothetical protein
MGVQGQAVVLGPVVEGQFQPVVPEEIFRCARNNSSPRNQEKAIAEVEGKMELMGGDGDTFYYLLTRQVPEKEKQLALVGRVQVYRRFVQKEDSRFLGEGPGNHDPLSFAVAELSYRAARQGGDAALLQGPGYCRVILFPGAPVGTPIGKAPQSHKLTNPEVRRRDVMGKDHRHRPGSAAPVQGAPAVEGVTFQKDGTRPGPQKARQRSQKGGLAASVGSDNAEKFTLSYVRLDVGEDIRPPAVSQPQVSRRDQGGTIGQGAGAHRDTIHRGTLQRNTLIDRCPLR